MSISIVGAGLSGLLAGNMLRHHNPTIVEAQKALPNNHSAVLRFKTAIIGDVLGIPFRKVTVLKSVIPWMNPVADALAYSYKNSGEYRSDRSIVSGNEVAERYISPPDLILRMAEHLTMLYNTKLNNKLTRLPIISTIAMPVLMKLLKYPNQPEFRCVQGFNVSAMIPNCDAYIGLTVPDPRHPFSRVSITGSHMIAEVPCPQKTGTNYASIAIMSAALVGIKPGELKDIQVSNQQYSKILPIDDRVRRDFIYWATNEHNIYSLGRFATWRPGLLMDSLVNDIRLIDGWIRSNDKYARFRHK
jgi:hypothetical protein